MHQKKMNKILQFIQKEKYFTLVAGLLLLLYLYASFSGRRICNCKTTESWKPGEQRDRGSGSHYRNYGRSGFYHK
jgi:hypothetical protein